MNKGRRFENISQSESHKNKKKKKKKKALKHNHKHNYEYTLIPILESYGEKISFERFISKLITSTNDDNYYMILKCSICGKEKSIEGHMFTSELKEIKRKLLEKKLLEK